MLDDSSCPIVDGTAYLPKGWPFDDSTLRFLGPALQCMDVCLGSFAPISGRAAMPAQPPKTDSRWVTPS
jgi:hypothetical protein